MTYRIKNWHTFQHYRDRRPPWIKLYTEIIERYDADGKPKRFYALDDQAKLTFVALLCLASRYNGTIPDADPAWLRDQTGLQAVVLQPLVDAGYLVASESASNDASKVATKVLGPDKEKDKETETEPERAPARTREEPAPENTNPDPDLDAVFNRRPQFPASHQTPEIQAAWDRWAAHNRESGKPLTSYRVGAHVAILARMTPEDAVRAIENAIARNLREPGLPLDGKKQGGRKLW